MKWCSRLVRWQQCYQKLVDNAKADIHTVGWYTIKEKEERL